MANQKISARTILTGTGAISTPVARAGSTTEYRRVDNLEATADPTVNDDLDGGYHIGSLWMRKDTGDMWRCLSAADGAAVWQLMTAGDVGVAVPWGASSGLYLTTPFHIPGSNGAMAANRLNMTPIWVTRTRQFTTYAFVLTAESGSTGVRLGLYNGNPATGLPTTKIDESSAVSTATGAGTGVKTAAFGVNQTLRPGLYFLASLSNGAPSVVRLTTASAGSAMGHLFATGSVSANPGVYRDGVTYTTLPADESGETYSILAGSGGQLPIVGIK